MNLASYKSRPLSHRCANPPIKPPEFCVMDRNTLATQEDIAKLKTDLLKEFSNLVQEAFGQMPNKRWLKSSDVKKILGISHGFLQMLRDEKILPYTRIGGAVYYDYQDLIQMMATNKNQ